MVPDRPPNSSGLRYCFSPEAVWVAGAVDAFVVLEDLVGLDLWATAPGPPRPPSERGASSRWPVYGRQCVVDVHVSERAVDETDATSKRSTAASRGMRPPQPRWSRANGSVLPALWGSSTPTVAIARSRILPAKKQLRRHRVMCRDGLAHVGATGSPDRAGSGLGLFLAVGNVGETRGTLESRGGRVADGDNLHEQLVSFHSISVEMAGLHEFVRHPRLGARLLPAADRLRVRLHRPAPRHERRSPPAARSRSATR